MPDRATIERTIWSCFDRSPAGVDAGYLFGRVARGDARGTSDVDLAVVRDILANRLDDLLALCGRSARG